MSRTPAPPRGLNNRGSIESRSHPVPPSVMVSGFTGIFVCAEVASATGWAIPGAMVHVVIVPILLALYANRRGGSFQPLLPVLALLSILRILSVMVAIPRLPMATWYVTVGGGLLTAEVLAFVLLRPSWKRLGLEIRRPRLDLGLAAAGIPAGLIGFVLLRPPPFIAVAGGVQVLVGIATLILFAAFAEELLFRGFLQSAAIEAYGATRFGVAYAATLAGLMYVGSGSVAYTLLVTISGLGLGFAISRGGSVWGATAGHSLALIGMAFVWPALL